MRSLSVGLLLLAACSESSFTSTGALRVTAVSPQKVSARGGSVVTIEGAGFDENTRVAVRNERAAIVSVSGDKLSFTMPRLTAGPASLRLEREADELTAKDALTVEPLALAFADAPSWLVPTLPAAPRALSPVGSELLVATDAGLVLLTTEQKALVSRPIPLALEGAQPRLRALAVDAATGLAAVCTSDEAAPIRLARGSSAGFVALDGGIGSPQPCTRLAFVRVTAGADAWLVAKTAKGLAAWRPDQGSFTPRAAPMPSFPGEITTFLSADLDGDGDEELLVAGRDEAGPWLRHVVLSSSDADEVRAPFPPPHDAAFGLAVLDATGDGHLDVFSAGAGQDALFVSDGHGQFFDDSWRMLPFERAEGRAVVAADLDLDGMSDLAIASADGPDRLFVAEEGVFLDRTPLLGLDGPYGSQAIALVDLDRDGDLDVITASQSGLRVRVLVEPGEAAP